MSSPGNKKKYGLILASVRRQENLHVAKGVRQLNPLQESDEELEKEEEDSVQKEDAMNWLQSSLKKSGGGNSAQLAQQQRLMREALEQDSSVFQYDEVYDELQSNKDSEQPCRKQEKKPKFIHNIIANAERRKLEKERRTERKVQREREAEKGLFDDKESFVTPAYLAKLEEIKRAEEKERIEAMVEEVNDVARHKNMGVFYQHLFKQRMGQSTSNDTQSASTCQEPSDKNATNTDKSLHDTSDSAIKITKLKDNAKNKKRYRSRKDANESEESSDDEVSSTKRKNNRRSMDASSNASTDDDNSERRERKEASEKRRSEPPRHGKIGHKRHSQRRRSRSLSKSRSPNRSSKKKTIVEGTLIKSEPESLDESSDVERKTKKGEKNKSQNLENSDKNEDKNKKPEILKETKEERIKRLFTKRCVGEKFTDAQQRYFQRKAERESSG